MYGGFYLCRIRCQGRLPYSSRKDLYTGWMARAYLHYDVFTSEPFTGNQLAVFLDGRGLPPERMQSIAREMAFSETTFIMPAEPAGTDTRMRIFTPGVKLPMAGHPTIGSTFAL